MRASTASTKQAASLGPSSRRCAGRMRGASSSTWRGLAKAPIAIEAVERIDALFAIERDINGQPPPERARVRNERSRPLVTELEPWLRKQRAKLSAKNEVAKAITYSVNQWRGLIRFLDDGRLCMSNNAAERALRCVAVGRNNWTFAGSDEGGRRAAAVYTLNQRRINGAGASSAILPSSTSCIAATDVTTLIIEAMRKTVSWLMVRADARGRPRCCRRCLRPCARPGSACRPYHLPTLGTEPRFSTSARLGTAGR
jgi:hypothetical protein